MPEGPNAYRAINAARDHEAYSGLTAHVLLVLATFGNSDGSSIFPSHQTIASCVGRSRRQVRRCIKQLLDDGVLELVRAGKGKSPAEYRLRVDRLGGTSTTALDGDREDTRDRPAELKGGHQRPLGGTLVTAGGDASDHQTYPYQSLPCARASARPGGGERARAENGRAHLCDACGNRANRFVHGRWLCAAHARDAAP